MILLCIILLLLLVPAGGYGYYRRADWGYAPPTVSLVLVAIVIAFLVRGIP